MDISRLNAYTLIEEKKLDEVEGVGYVLSHNKTKARVLVVENSDKNKVFTIGFRTPPKDDTGVAHIMEHSVLCGSKNFPVKDPFVELCKGSLNTFLNAMTYSDKTVYPVASLNDKDFHNLMHVYLDAVFYPNIYEKEEIMMQEGWHYEIDEETEKVIYNGVVYNEMKGVYSNPEQQLFRSIMNSLLPDTAYGKESGGDPMYITDLTREDFLEFHRKFYHPSNSYIYLYGDMDSVAELEFIDKEYLSSFDYREVDSELTIQPEFEEPSYMTDFYSLSDAEEEKDNTYLSYNVAIGRSTDKELCVALSIIDSALIGMPGAPLKEALIDSGICKDAFSSVDDGILQPIFSIIAKNSNPDDEDRFIKIIDSTLKSIVENGIDKKSFLASINKMEFKHKEGDTGRFPKGLMIGLDTFSSWLYDDSMAYDRFELNEVFDKLKKEIDTGYFEKLIRRLFLDNRHKSYLKLVPKKGLNEQREKEEREKLDAYTSKLSEAELENIAKKAERLKEYQDSEDTKEALATLPLLEIDDIDKQARRLNNHFYKVSDINIISHDIFTNGISYIGLVFDITDIDEDKLPYVGLLAEIFKYVDTEHFSYNELAGEISIHLGGLGIATTVINTEENGGFKVQFLVNAKMFDDKVDKGIELIEEVLFTSDITNKKRLKEIVAETRSAIKNDIVASGHITASARALSYISAIGVCKELLEGMDYYSFLSDIDDNFEDRYDELAENLTTVLSEILRRDSMILSYTGKCDVEKLFANNLNSLSARLSTRLSFDKKNTIPVTKKNEAYKTASQVQYVAAAGNFRDKGLEYTGALTVLTTIFSYDYLWLNVRVKGGAYGCMCAFARSGNAYFTSYRDPNLMETYEIYKKAPEFVANFNCDDRDMTKYIIGAISRLDAPLSPATEGNLSLAAWFMGQTDEDLQRERDEILGCNVESIRTLAPYVSAIIDTDTICVIGNSAKIEKAKDNFDNIIDFM